MSKGNTFETDLLEFVFNGTALPSDYDGPFYVALHTADPGETGSPTTSEATYTSYARVSVARTSGGWTVSGNQAVNAAAINFPACTGGSNTITHFSIVTSSSGAGIILYKGALSASLAVSSGITPSIDAGDLVVSED